MERPLYPSPYMRITQGYGIGTHRDSYAIDDGGMDTGIDNIKAPFTGIIKKIYTADANEVWLESVDQVLYPDGTIDYMTILFVHDNDVSNLFVGKLINRGEVFYQEGTKGNATGNHCHIECAKGKFTGTGWYKNASGYWGINNAKKPEECLWIDDSIKILNSNGYSFKSIPKDNVSPPTNDVVNDNDLEVDDNTNTNTENSNVDIDIKEKPRLIFTCKSTDIYAINLKEGQKLYLE